METHPLACAKESKVEIGVPVVEFATESALRYRTMAGVRHDNECCERFLRSHVASRLKIASTGPPTPRPARCSVGIRSCRPGRRHLGNAPSATTRRRNPMYQRRSACRRPSNSRSSTRSAPRPVIGVAIRQGEANARVEPLRMQIVLGAKGCPNGRSLEYSPASSGCKLKAARKPNPPPEAIGGNVIVGEPARPHATADGSGSLPAPRESAVPAGC